MIRIGRLRRAAATISALAVALITLTPVTASAMTPVLPAYGPYTATTTIDGRGSMDPNDRIKTNAYVTGQTLYLTCQDTGPSYGGSTIWDYTTDKYWEPDAYIKTGTSGFVSGIPRCLSLGIDGRSKVGSIQASYPAEVDIDGRGSMNVNDRIKYNAYLAGSQVFIKCQDTGPAVNSDTVWDYTADGYWIPDTYVKTGTSGMVSGMPVCSTLGISGTSTTNLNGGQRYTAAVDLNGYSAKSLTSSSVNNAYMEGTDITVMCQAYGQYNYGGDAIWDRTAEGYWVADYYVHTGSSTFVMSRCDSDSPSGGSGGKYLVETTLNGYSAKSLTSSYVNNMYAGGSYITVVCQAYGAFNYGGSAVWDKTSDGVWVADYYVKTGYTDIFMTRCDSDPKPTGGSGNPTVPSTPTAGSIASSLIRDKIVNAATSQLGMHEWGDNCNPYGTSGVNCGSPWCSIFASWAWRQAGINVSLPYSGDFYWWGLKNGTLRSTSNIRPGDLVLFGSGPSASNHVGVVVDVEPGGEITTVEGNFHNAVTEVGPYLPSDAATVHPGDGPIFAVVSPVNDSGDTQWGYEADPSQNSSADQAKQTPVCSTNTSGPDYPEYKLCLQINSSDKIRALVVATPNAAENFNASITMTIGTASITAHCLTVYDSGERTCSTQWWAEEDRNYSADAAITVNGSPLYTQHVQSMWVIGNQQTAYDYCGPAATQAALLTMGASAPSMDTLAAEEQTTSYDFTLPTNIPASLNSRIGTNYKYSADFFANEGLPELMGLQAIKQSLDDGKPVILLVNPSYLPASWNISSGTVLRHYILIYGYGGQDNQLADGVPFDMRQFNIWDPANNVTHTMNLSQLYTYTYDAELIGTGSFVAITASAT